MNTTENQNDPYAHLKQAWEEGRRIRCRDVRGDWTPWNKKGGGCGYGWDVPPDRYEIEPLPADKWAAEKAAHAQGKRIEYCEKGTMRWGPCPVPLWLDDAGEYRIAPDPVQTYHTPNVVQQRREEAAAINTAMNPAPAGKLSDAELGEIGRAAVKAGEAYIQDRQKL